MLDRVAASSEEQDAQPAEFNSEGSSTPSALAEADDDDAEEEAARLARHASRRLNRWSRTPEELARRSSLAVCEELEQRLTECHVFEADEEESDDEDWKDDDDDDEHDDVRSRGSASPDIGETEADTSPTAPPPRLASIPQGRAERESRRRRTAQPLVPLEKSGFMQKKTGAFSGLKKRYFVLQSGTLLWYKSPKDRAPTGYVHLSACKLAEAGTSKEGCACFSVKARAARRLPRRRRRRRRRPPPPHASLPPSPGSRRPRSTCSTPTTSPSEPRGCARSRTTQSCRELRGSTAATATRRRWRRRRQSRPSGGRRPPRGLVHVTSTWKTRRTTTTMRRTLPPRAAAAAAVGTLRRRSAACWRACGCERRSGCSGVR